MSNHRRVASSEKPKPFVPFVVSNVQYFGRNDNDHEHVIYTETPLSYPKSVSDTFNAPLNNVRPHLLPNAQDGKPMSPSEITITTNNLVSNTNNNTNNNTTIVNSGPVMNTYNVVNNVNETKNINNIINNVVNNVIVENKVNQEITNNVNNNIVVVDNSQTNNTVVNAKNAIVHNYAQAALYQQIEDIRKKNLKIYGDQYRLWRVFKEQQLQLQSQAKNKNNSTGAVNSGSGVLRRYGSVLGRKETAKIIMPSWQEQGYKPLVNSKGHPYLIRQNAFNSNQMEALKQDRKQKKLPFWARWSTMEDVYGLGVKLYFDFARILVVLNAILFLIQLLNIVAHIVVDYNSIASSLSLDVTIFDQLYTSSYSPQLYWVWLLTNAVCIAISLAFGPIYWFIVKSYYDKRDLYDCEEDILDNDSNIIKENKKVGLVQKIFRMMISYFIFFTFMMIAFAVTMGLTILQNVNAVYELADSTFSTNGNILTGISFGISIVVSVMSVIWKKISVHLTNFEKHSTWSSYRKHNTFKFLFFKIFSVFVVGFTKGFFATPCVIKVMGNQYMIQIVTDFLISSTLELCAPFIAYKVKDMFSKEGVIVSKPEFDVAEEYLELIYRQYLIYNGFVSFPLITLIGFASSVAELYFDKFRLIKMSHKPPLTTGSVKSVVFMFLMIAAILPILNWAGGNAYILSGYYWCNTPSDIECSPCALTNNGRFPNVIQAMFEST